MPIAPAPCELPYGLSWEDLRPVLPDADFARGQPQAFESHRKQGLHGGANSCILTLRYSDGHAEAHSTPVFIKTTDGPERAEAARYRFLAERGVPTPRLLAAVARGQREIVVLEFLPAIGIDVGSPSDVQALLDLVADLNAVQGVPTDIVPPPRPPQPRADAVFDAGVLAALREAARTDDAGGVVDPTRWFEAYRAAQQAYALLPQALIHGQFAFQQVGWADRESGRQLVVFDLETLGFSARFGDVANVLESLAAGLGCAQAELFAHYLARYAWRAGTDFNVDHALRELHLTRLTESFWTLPWLVSEVREPSSTALDWREALRSAVTGLHKDLLDLSLA